MKNKALIVTIISFLGILLLLTLLFATNFNLLASVPILITLFSSFTLGLCSCMIGTFQKSSKWFTIVALPTFLLTALAVFNSELYVHAWNVVFLLHIGLITWTLIQISPAIHPILQIFTRATILFTALLFGIIIVGNSSSSLLITSLKIGMIVSSSSLILQTILQLRTNKS